jgi:hypothetical protein
MKKILFTLIILLFTCLSLVAGERTRRNAMYDSTGNSPEQPITMVEVDSAGSRAVWFYFDYSNTYGKRGVIQRSGYDSFIAWFDSSSSSTANDDTVDIDLSYLVYDPVDEQYEEFAVSETAGDSTNHLTISSFKWRTSHGDDKASIRKTLNIPAGISGIKAVFATRTATNAFKFWAEVHSSEDR